MKKPFAMLCGTVALLCLVSMFIPIIAPRYSADYYHPGSEDYTKDYILSGGYYYAREYWSISRFALSSGDNVKRIALSVSMALLLYWSTLCFMGETAVVTGIGASIANLVITGYLLMKMFGVMAGCRWEILVVLAINTVMAVVVAVVQKRDAAEDEKKGDAISE